MSETCSATVNLAITLHPSPSLSFRLSTPAAFCHTPCRALNVQVQPGKPIPNRGRAFQSHSRTFICSPQTGPVTPGSFRPLSAAGPTPPALRCCPTAPPLPPMLLRLLALLLLLLLASNADRSTIWLGAWVEGTADAGGTDSRRCSGDGHKPARATAWAQANTNTNALSVRNVSHLCPWLGKMFASYIDSCPCRTGDKACHAGVQASVGDCLHALQRIEGKLVSQSLPPTPGST